MHVMDMTCGLTQAKKRRRTAMVDPYMTDALLQAVQRRAGDPFMKKPRCLLANVFLMISFHRDCCVCECAKMPEQGIVKTGICPSN